MSCPACGKEVKQTPGKRQKVYCNNNCRQAWFHRKDKPKMRLIPLAEYEALLKSGQVTKPVKREMKELEGLLGWYDK